MSQRGDTTKHQLVDAAAAVFTERGFARATTREIAERAGVSEGTIYRHFTDKRDLFGAVFASRNAADFEAITALPALAGTKTVRENLLFLIEAIQDVEREVAPLRAAASTDADLAVALVSARSASAAGTAVGPLEPLTHYLEAEQRLGRIRVDVDCASAAFALFAIPFAAVTMNRLARATGASADNYMVGAVDIVLRGILMPD
ncbi:MAG: TetR/AcrR family transcriptional regulator [Actinobacteria bacterium]|nr:TetR/AcrR family transcriptional regulator [Actinomycetota bacterium]